MTSGLVTWDELGRLDGNVLAVLNSRADDEQAVAGFFDELDRHVAPTGLHVIAAPHWRPSLAARRLADDRTLFTVDDQGREIELNHFLEAPVAVRWAMSRRFQTILGSAAHGLYHDEIKDVFGGASAKR